jgi:N-acetylglucosaminyldiphosphoundecaprenol N-acetyl-beta-D-mannosaminyltransferase
MAARADAAVLRILNAADIATPDGMPVVWALRSLGVKNQQRVYGPTLMLRLCEEAAKTGFRLFLFGGRSEALSGLERNLKARWPLLDICGTYSPPFRPLNPGEQREICERILSSGADLIFVGISTPKQEFWMWENRNSFPGVVMIGVGAAFDFHSGRVKQAPAWMQQCGLEWAFRLGMEPRRLWKRYLLVTPLFLPLWAGQKVGLVEGGVSPENDACEVTRFEGGSVPIGEKSRPRGEAKSVTTATTPGCRS